MNAPPERWSVSAEDRDARAIHVAKNLLADHAEADPGFLVTHIVNEQPRGAAVIHQHNVNVPIVIHVAEGGAATHFHRGKSRACTIGHVAEGAVSIVMKQDFVLRERIRAAFPRLFFDQGNGPIVHQQVELAVIVVVEHGDTEAGVAASGHRDAGFIGAILESVFAVAVDIGVLAGQIGDHHIFLAAAKKVARIDPHAGMRAAIAIQSTTEGQGLVLEGAIMLIDPELVGTQIVGDKNVGPPIPVEVGAHHAQGPVKLAADSRTQRYILESTVTPIAKQAIGEGFEGQRTAIIDRAARGEAGFQVSKAEIHIVADEEIEPAIAVKIDEGGTAAPPENVGAALRSDIGEGAIAVVAPQLIVAEIGDVEIDPAIVVKVAGGDAHSVAEGADATLLGDIGELEGDRAVRVTDRVVAVELATQRHSGREYSVLGILV